jgi:transcriptional regulator with XRE-family HTH domain
MGRMEMAPRNTLDGLLARFGENVRRERRARRLTQAELAERVDLCLRMVQKIEAGKTNVLMTTVLRLQAALECPWASLLPPIGVAKFTKPEPCRRGRPPAGKEAAG